MNKQDIIKALEELPDDVIILPQVTALNGDGWSMEMKISDVLDHFNWGSPVACLSLSHPSLVSLNPPTWKASSE